MELLFDPNAWVALATLTVMEIVLGIDNIVFISVLVSRLPPEQANKARKWGLALALIFRIALLSVIWLIIGLTAPVFTAFDHAFSWKDLILIAGGAFLVYKATHEMHAAIEEPHETDMATKAGSAFGAIIVQIIIIDMVFSIDSIITAVGMAEDIAVMIAAVVIAVGIMFVASGPVARFVAEHPTTKMLALAFLLLIGVSLVLDGVGVHIDKGYIYAAMGFSVLVEAFNIIMKQRKAARLVANGGDPHRLAAAATVPGNVAAATLRGDAPRSAKSVVAPRASATPAAPAPKPRAKTSPQSRAQARPKSAPRPKKP